MKSVLFSCNWKGGCIFLSLGMCKHVLNHVRLFATSWAVARQPPLSMGFFRQEYGVDCHFVPQGLYTGSEPASLVSPALAGRFFTTSAI